MKYAGERGIYKAPLCMQLVIPLEKQRGPLFRRVYLGLREAILSGTLGAGEQLPSTRQLAEQLGISRTVVLLAYEHLLAEGFAEGRHGSGTYVSKSVGTASSRAPQEQAELRMSRFGRSAAATGALAGVSPRRLPPLRYDFAFGRSDIEIFPFEAWRRILLRQARRASVRDLDYGSTAGAPALREAISAHLRRARAVVCDPSQVVVVNGSQQALDLVTRVLVERGDCVAIEDPQYLGAREVLRAAGSQLHPVPVDHEGLNPSRLPDKARLLFVTPSHQFPTGVILSLPRRLALLEWAKRRNAVIVEDDYDGEFRYQGQPLESLQGLDRQGRVIYVGTFSRTVFPALRIGYMIVPQSLTPAFTAAKWLSDRHSAMLEQQALAEFIATGLYERHLRRLRRKSAARRQALLQGIHEFLGDRVEVTGDSAGAHVVLWPRGRMSEEAVVARAASKSVGIYGISRYYLKRPLRTGIMLGYWRLNEQEIREGLFRLGEAL